jgi:hypothetical protein
LVVFYLWTLVLVWFKTSLCYKIDYYYGLYREKMDCTAYREKVGLIIWWTLFNIQWIHIKSWILNFMGAIMVVNLWRSWQGVLNTTLCDKDCQWLATGWWFSVCTPVSSTNKTDHHDLTVILLKVALNTINLIEISWFEELLYFRGYINVLILCYSSYIWWHIFV